MTRPIHHEAVEKILSALYLNGDVELSSFLYGIPGAADIDKKFGTTLYVLRQDYLRALLFIRKNGAPYLRTVSVGTLWSMVTTFLTDNYWHIRDQNLTRVQNRSFTDQVAATEKEALANALAASSLFAPLLDLTLHPLLTVTVVDPYEADCFFFLSGASLAGTRHVANLHAVKVDSNQFPPVDTLMVRRRTTESWLGIYSPSPETAQKMSAAILGGLALNPLPWQRYSFSGRGMFGGRFTITSRSYGITGSDDPHTPPLMRNIVLTAADHSWLDKLTTLLKADDKLSRAKLRALEYFYRAWFLDPRERFSVLCMSLDSLVGAEHGHTAAAVTMINNSLGVPADDQRLRLLMRLRGAVIHGAAPDVYDSENYEKYYVDYETDPVHDLELVIAKCLRFQIFGAMHRYHADPDADLIVELRGKGRFPLGLRKDAIILPSS